MTDIRLSIAPKIYFSIGALNKLGKIVSENGERALIVTEAILYEHKVIDRIKENFDKKGIAYIVYDEVIPNSTSQVVEDGIKIARGAHIDTVIGIGGIKTLSIAKCIAMAAPTEREIYEFLDGPPRQSPL